jgi:hypothetical protein
MSLVEKPPARDPSAPAETLDLEAVRELSRAARGQKYWRAL